MTNPFSRACPLVLVGLLHFSSVLASPPDESDWQQLFNGRDLSGWNPINVAVDTFTVRDGVIVCMGSPAGFLVSNRAYKNFVLEVEWCHLQRAGNSGIMIWSSELPAPGAPFPQAVEIQVLDPGYEQGRINAGRNFTGHGDIMGIRGTVIQPLDRVSENGRRALPVESRVRASPEWNYYRVEARNGTVTLAVNGVVVSRATEVVPHHGFIALQSEGAEIHFRNIRIKELPSSSTSALPTPSGFRALLNGRDLNGWQTAKPGITQVWSITDGVIASQAKVPGKDLHLWTTEPFRDFDLIVDWRTVAQPAMRSRATFTPDGLYALDAQGKQIRQEILDAGDSGIFLRGAPLYQVNIWSQPMGSGDINELHKDPTLSPDLRRAMLPRERADRPFGDWNRFFIQLRGDRVTVWLNDILIVEDVLLPDIPTEGPIGLQYHRDAFEFRNLFIRPR